LFAPRITGEMGTQLFAVGIRNFVSTPVDDSALLEGLGKFITAIKAEKGQVEVSQRLEHAQVLLARRLNEMNTLSRIGRVITNLSDIDDLLSRIVEAAVFLTHAEEGAIFLLEKDSKDLILRAEKGFDAKKAEVIRQPSSDSDAMEVARMGKPIMKSGESEHKLKTGYLVRALINVPIVVEKKVIGVLGVYHHGMKSSFTDPDMAVLSNLADYAAIALDRVNLLAQHKERLDAMLEVSRKVSLHAKTLSGPVEGIDGQVELLLSGSTGELGDKQRSAVTRIRQATTRLQEIVGFIEEEMKSIANAST
jgi:two-component system NtrC family sensor kinase